MKKIVSCSDLFPGDDGLQTQMPQPDETLTDLQSDVRRLRESVFTTLVQHRRPAGPYSVPRNILLIGQPSAGKSSLINLLKSSLLGRYDEIAPPGATGEGSCPQFTNRLNAYPNMGLTEIEFEEVKAEFPIISFPPDFCLPTIYDMPGLQNNPFLVLDCVLDGVVPDGVELVTPLAQEALPPVDLSEPAVRAIDRVVFVASIAQDVSVDQFSEAFHAAFRTRAIPYTLLFTHGDQSASIGRRDEGRRSNEATRREDSKALLWITKNSKLLSHDVVNYCDKDPTSAADASLYEVDLEKHKEALEAFKKIIKPKKRPTWRRISSRYDLWFRYLCFKISRLSEGWLIRLILISLAAVLSLYAVFYGLPTV